MTIHAPEPTSLGITRLLMPTDGTFAGHRRVHGRPLTFTATDLVDATHQVRLLGRGGAAFPVSHKLAAVSPGSRTSVVVNGREGEPASHKDRTLMRASPHLVLDGAAVVATALRTDRVVIAITDASVAAVLRAAIAEREDRDRFELDARAGRFVAGEARALIRGLHGQVAVPPGRRMLPSDHGLSGHPTFVSNAETFAHLALLATLGPQRYAEVGDPAEPGTTLLTLVGHLRRTGVVEVPTGVRLDALTGDGLVLLGGYHGAWVDAADLVVSRPALRKLGLSLGAGTIARLPRDTCHLGEVARVTRWLADQSAGQCGPCVFGLPTIADDVDAIYHGTDTRTRVDRRAGVISGRGACSHPDAAIRFATSALATMSHEVRDHLERGGCGRPLLNVLPIGGAA